MKYTRDQLKGGLKDHMEQVEYSTVPGTDLLKNPEYRTAACLLSIMDKQDGSKETPSKTS